MERPYPAIVPSKSDNFLSGRCPNLRYIFILNMARSLKQLKVLSEMDCHVDESMIEGNDVDLVLPNMRELWLGSLSSLISFCPKGCNSTWPSLQQLDIQLSWTPSFVNEHEVNMQIPTCLLHFDFHEFVIKLISIRGVGVALKGFCIVANYNTYLDLKMKVRLN